jgi:hypothetical protein
MDTPAPQTPKPRFVDILLDEPLQIGDRLVETLQLRKPDSGELRGLSLVALGQMSVDEIHKLLPRITTPTLPPAVVVKIDPADMMQIAEVITDFLLTKRQRAGLPMT